MSKRRTLARSMELSGMTRLLETLPARPGILVINHHRIGNANASRFDRGVFSATEEQLDAQVSYVKRRFAIVCGDELQELISQRRPLKKLYVAFTFDDGYLDNYRLAFPIFEAHSVGAIFFLVPEYVGTSTIPWWDEIAFYVRNTQAEDITLSTPVPLTVAVDGSREKATRQVLQHYKRPDNTDPLRFMADLKHATGCHLPESGRRFLNWEEALEMQRAGMEIGSHTVTHRVLSQLSFHSNVDRSSPRRMLNAAKRGWYRYDGAPLPQSDFGRDTRSRSGPCHGLEELSPANPGVSRSVIQSDVSRLVCTTRQDRDR